MITTTLVSAKPSGNVADAVAIGNLITIDRTVAKDVPFLSHMNMAITKATSTFDIVAELSRIRKLYHLKGHFTVVSSCAVVKDHIAKVLPTMTMKTFVVVWNFGDGSLLSGLSAPGGGIDKKLTLDESWPKVNQAMTILPACLDAYDSGALQTPGSFLGEAKVIYRPFPGLSVMQWIYENLLMFIAIILVLTLFIVFVVQVSTASTAAPAPPLSQQSVPVVAAKGGAQGFEAFFGV